MYRIEEQVSFFCKCHQWCTPSLWSCVSSWDTLPLKENNHKSNYTYAFRSIDHKMSSQNIAK